MSLSLSKCDFCKHLHKDDKRNIPVCDAFPNGIPVDTEMKAENAECANGIKYEEDSND